MREIEKTMIREIFSNAGQWKKSFSCRDSVECKTDNINFTFFKEYKIDTSKRYRINFVDSILREV